MSESSDELFTTAIIHPVTGEKEIFTGSTKEEVEKNISERFGE